MSEELLVSDILIGNVEGNFEGYSDNENIVESANQTLDHDSEMVDTEIDQPAILKKGGTSAKTEAVRSTKLPIARIKHIMKLDPDVNILTADAVFLVTKATEMFLETIVKETYSYTSSNKRKVISKKDLDNVINNVDCLCFLEGAMDF